MGGGKARLVAPAERMAGHSGWFTVAASWLSIRDGTLEPCRRGIPENRFRG